MPHERAIWDADIVVIDELPRARKETQNLFLEILGEDPPGAASVVGTMNPDTYAASYRMDAALGDRFCMVLPVPEHQGELDDAARRQLLAVALANNAPLEELASRLAGLPGLLGEIKANYARLAEGPLPAQAQELATLLLGLYFQTGEKAQNGQPGYISPRRQAMLVRAIVGISAARLALGGVTELPPALVRQAAKDAIRYVFSTSLLISWVALKGLYDQIAVVLDGDLGAEGEFRYRLAQAGPPDRLQLILEQQETFLRLGADEREKLLGEILKAAGEIDIIALDGLIQGLPGHEELKLRSLGVTGTSGSPSPEGRGSRE